MLQWVLDKYTANNNAENILDKYTANNNAENKHG